ncbi:16744_t:CDS:1, partial [Funneliformis geosporum]
KLDNIENKLILISDKIVSIKNDLIEYRQNEEDIGFRLNHLECIHNFEHNVKQVTDPNYVFPSHNEYFMIDDTTLLTTHENLTPITPNESSVPNINSS